MKLCLATEAVQLEAESHLKPRISAGHHLSGSTCDQTIQHFPIFIYLMLTVIESWDFLICQV